jgi:hypothetical protein
MFEYKFCHCLAFNDPPYFIFANYGMEGLESIIRLNRQSIRMTME